MLVVLRDCESLFRFKSCWLGSTSWYSVRIQASPDLPTYVCCVSCRMIGAGVCQVCSDCIRFCSGVGKMLVDVLFRVMLVRVLQILSSAADLVRVREQCSTTQVPNYRIPIRVFDPRQDAPSELLLPSHLPSSYTCASATINLQHKTQSVCVLLHLLAAIIFGPLVLSCSSTLS
jgi:hypothetical protein